MTVAASTHPRFGSSPFEDSGTVTFVLGAGVLAFVVLAVSTFAFASNPMPAPVVDQAATEGVMAAEISGISLHEDSYVVWWSADESGVEILLRWDAGEGSNTAIVTPYRTNGELRPSTRPEHATEICGVPVPTDDRVINLASVSCVDIPS